MLLILMSDQIETNYPRPGGQTADGIPVGSETRQSRLQLAYNSVQGIKDPIGEFLLAQLVPDMLLRVQFRGVARQAEKVNVLGDVKVL